MAGNRTDRTYRNHKSIMENQSVFVRIPIPERGDHLLSEISLHSVRIGIEFKYVGYDVFDDPFGYIDDDWEIMSAHLWCE